MVHIHRVYGIRRGSFCRIVQVSALTLLTALLCSTAAVAQKGKPKPPPEEPPPAPTYTLRELYFVSDLGAWANAINQQGDVVGMFSSGSWLQVMHPGTSEWVVEQNVRSFPFYYDAQLDLLQPVSDLFDVAPEEQWPLVEYADGTKRRYAVFVGAENEAWLFESAGDVNNHRQVVGSGWQHIYDAELGRYVSQNSVAIRINYGLNGANTIDRLDHLGADLGPAAMNDFGDLAGTFTNSDGLRRAFLYSNADQSLIDIGDLGFGGMQPVKMNGVREIVGTGIVQVSGGLSRRRAFYYSPQAGMVNLGVFKNSVDASSGANDVNEAGVVVGWARTGRSWQPTMRAFRYTLQTGLQDLGTLGGDQSSASGINGHGVIVGAADTTEGTHRAFLFTDELGMVQLEPLVQTWPPEYTGTLRAHRINDLGQICGTVGNTGGVPPRACVLLPVP